MRLVLALCVMIDALIDFFNAKDSSRDLAINTTYDIDPALVMTHSDLRQHVLLVTEREKPARVLLKAFEDLFPLVARCLALIHLLLLRRLEFGIGLRYRPGRIHANELRSLRRRIRILLTLRMNQLLLLRRVNNLVL